MAMFLLSPHHPLSATRIYASRHPSHASIGNRPVLIFLLFCWIGRIEERGHADGGECVILASYVSVDDIAITLHERL